MPCRGRSLSVSRNENLVGFASPPGHHGYGSERTFFVRFFMLTRTSFFFLLFSCHELYSWPVHQNRKNNSTSENSFSAALKRNLAKEGLFSAFIELHEITRLTFQISVISRYLLQISLILVEFERKRGISGEFFQLSPKPLPIFLRSSQRSADYKE